MFCVTKFSSPITNPVHKNESFSHHIKKNFYGSMRQQLERKLRHILLCLFPSPFFLIFILNKFEILDFITMALQYQRVFFHGTKVKNPRKHNHTYSICHFSYLIANKINQIYYVSVMSIIFAPWFYQIDPWISVLLVFWRLKLNYG